MQTDHPAAAAPRYAPKSIARLVRNATLCALALAGLGACSAATPGASGYSCTGVPDGVVCTSTRDMHRLTGERDRVHEADLEALAAPGPQAGGAAAAAAGASPARAASAGPREGVIDSAALAPVPVAVFDPDALRARQPRTAEPSVVRIWIAPWEDRNGDLRMPGHVFAEVRPRRWALSSRPPHVTDNHLQTPAMIDARNSGATPGAAAPTPPAGQPLGRRPPPELGPSQRRRPGEVIEVRS
jgi:conjugal transfer pilus assembly protein TraV